jgi:hypothetical protein
MLLSGPLTMAVKIALETDPRTRWFAVLLGPAGQAAETKVASAEANQADEAKARDKQASA